MIQFWLLERNLKSKRRVKKNNHFFKGFCLLCKLTWELPEWIQVLHKMGCLRSYWQVETKKFIMHSSSQGGIIETHQYTHKARLVKIYGKVSKAIFHIWSGLNEKTWSFYSPLFEYSNSLPDWHTPKDLQKAEEQQLYCEMHYTAHIFHWLNESFLAFPILSLVILLLS